MVKPFHGSPDPQRLYDEVVQLWIKKKEKMKIATQQPGKASNNKRKQKNGNPWVESVKAIYSRYKPFPKFLLIYPKERDFRSVIATVGGERRRQKKLEQEQLKVIMLTKKASEGNHGSEPIILNKLGQYGLNL